MRMQPNTASAHRRPNKRFNGNMRVVATYERNQEMRYAGVAKTAAGVLIDITFTLRSGRLRPISVHKVKRAKRERYEKES